MTDAEKLVDQRRKETEEQLESGVKTVYSSSMGFLISTGKALFWIILYFTIGSILIYCSKTGSLNLSENNTCIPTMPTHEIDVFIHDKISQKFKLDDSDHNKKRVFLDMFRNYMNKPKGKSNFFIYIISILEPIMLLNNQWLNFTFSNILYKNFSELWILLFGPIILTISAAVLLIGDSLYIALLWLFSLAVFFKKEDDTGKMVWLSGSKEIIMKGTVALFSIGVVFAVTIILFLISLGGTAIFLGLIPALILSSLFGIAMYKGKFKTGENKFDKDLSVGSIIIESFKFFKVKIMILLSIVVTVNAFTNLGAIAGLFAVVVILLIAYKFIDIGLFEKIPAGYETPLSKDCNPSKLPPVQTTPDCGKPGEPCKQSGGGKQSGGIPKRKVTQGYLEQFFDDVTGKTHKDLMRQIHRLSTF